MKRFSKIVSRMCEVPSARQTSAISCAWRSVGKPGNGSVVTSTGARPLPFRRTRMPWLVGGDLGADLRSAPRAASRRIAGVAPSSSTSPPVMATAMA